MNLKNPETYAVMMLKHIGKHPVAKRIEEAIAITLKDKNVITQDLGGVGSLSKMTNAIIERL